MVRHIIFNYLMLCYVTQLNDLVAEENPHDHIILYVFTRGKLKARKFYIKAMN